MSPASPGARILILNFNDYELLDETMQKMIETYQWFIFTVVCTNGSLGELWAKNNGAPIEYFVIKTDDTTSIINQLVKRADYLVAAYDGKNNFCRQLMMKMKMEDKHGESVRI